MKVRLLFRFCVISEICQVIIFTFVAEIIRNRRSDQKRIRLLMLKYLLDRDLLMPIYHTREEKFFCQTRKLYGKYCINSYSVKIRTP